VLKRLFDIVAAIAILLLCAPLFLIVSATIKVCSPGPIFYHAKRVGRGEKLFEMFKFRSMNVSNHGAVITSVNDARIFPFGNTLRRLKIDELPQFINVLFGDMSIVGPRPEDPKIVRENYTDWMKETLAVRPGITSPGAIYYYAIGEQKIDPADPEESYVNFVLAPKLAVDRAYLDRASLSTDIFCALQTVLPVKRDLDAAQKWSNPTQRRCK
jgi:lipopolysaccharide/colanic/teichoic acid biosynthesis glycosyltransferase